MSWQQEFKDSLKTNEDLRHFFNFDFPQVNFPLFIPKGFAEKIKLSGPNSALWKQFLPHENENNVSLGRLDPIGDKVHAKNNQLIHRYENRVLFTPTTVCPILCRYCFRKNELSSKDEIFDQKFKEAITYLKQNTAINEIIFTGGDPFILSDEKLAYYLQEFSEIESIKYIRFHTRTPVILPSRIDDGLVAILLSAKALFKKSMVMIHVNHIDELSGDVIAVIESMIENGIEVYSQSVLLKGVNDTTKDLADLFTGLSDIGVKPYYLHHPDEALGAMHFHMNLEEGRKIFAPLHHQLSGWALPQYVIDIPGGEGKTPAFNPESFQFAGFLINRKGEKVKIN